MAQTNLISVVSPRISTFHYSFRRFGTIVLYRSHGSNKLNFCSVGRNFDLSWFVPTNRNYCTLQITRCKQASFLLWCVEFRPFVIRSDESGPLYCENHTAQTSFMSVLSSWISTFSDSFRRIGTFVPYRSHWSNKLHFCCCIWNFEHSWFLRTNWGYFAEQITRLKQVSLLLWQPEFRNFVNPSDELGPLYRTDHTN
jgi:hypothetical protein